MVWTHKLFYLLFLSIQVDIMSLRLQYDDNNILIQEFKGQKIATLLWPYNGMESGSESESFYTWSCGRSPKALLEIIMCMSYVGLLYSTVICNHFQKFQNFKDSRLFDRIFFQLLNGSEFNSLKAMEPHLYSESDNYLIMI